MNRWNRSFIDYQLVGNWVPVMQGCMGHQHKVMVTKRSLLPQLSEIGRLPDWAHGLVVQTDPPGAKAQAYCAFLSFNVWSFAYLSSLRAYFLF